MTITVVKTRGPLSVQDSGRPGYAHLAVPYGGAADPAAAVLANRLVGNLDHAPVLEWALAGPDLHFRMDDGESGPVALALTGAMAVASLDSRRVNSHRTILAKDDQRLEVRGPGAGVYGYIGIGAKLSVERWLGSCSPLRMGETVMPPGAQLERGVCIEAMLYGKVARAFAKPVTGQRESPGSYLCSTLDDTEGVAYVTEGSVWQVKPQTNRMGIRLGRLSSTTSDLRPPSAHEASVPVWPGVIQWLPSGELNVVNVDGQTTGGYTRVAEIDRISLARLSQLRMGDTVSFMPSVS